ncbi:MAG: hypothetical protein Q7K13_03205 [Polynucleobacter sp.]|uniref:cobaltochelatase CobT-related protein n=1 Tax=Polynucleobacter sp. TaxID=2029855 RepID=UPI0027245D0F|nr:hypothetical protein [Polynucleobacter sp.]MDO8713472.1 hypothetical protein [Polynucleobacter sp.]
MQTETHLEFEQQRLHGAMIRALSGESSAQFRDWQLFYKSAPFGVIAPHLNPEYLKASWSHPRGVIDGIGLRLRYSNIDLHHSLSPEGLIESLMFEVLEQIRVESICPDDLIGGKQNTQAQFVAWMQQFIANGGAEGSIGLLLITIFSTVWMRLNALPLPQLMQDIVESTRAGLADNMGVLLVELKANRSNQSTYAETALRVIDLVSDFITEEYRNNPSLRTKRKKQSATISQIEWIPPNNASILSKRNTQEVSINEKRRLLKKSLSQYRIYIQQYDTEVDAKKTIRPAQLAIYQAQLNEEIAKQNIPWAKLIRNYQQIFSSNTSKRWQSTEVEGLIDRRYLIRAATSPLQPSIYKQHSQKLEAQAKITCLIDCSGSMKEQRLKIAACVDSFVRVLEQAGIQTEVLGYSTNAWQGGRPFKEWRKQGQIPNPGRLNERAHWIFKDFNTSWRRSRPGIAALLRPEIYAESIDGEALLWAAERLQKNSSTKNLNTKLILFSDGCPMDRATIEANGEDLLKDHLLQAITWSEQQPNFQLWGCGIGNELRSAFKNRLSWGQLEGKIGDHITNWAKEFKSNSN